MCAVQHSFDPGSPFGLKSQSLPTSRQLLFVPIGVAGGWPQIIVFAAVLKVLSAQAILTIACVLVAGLGWGAAAALAATAGGGVVLVSSLAYGAAFFWRSPRDAGNPGRALRTVLFAEAIKWMIAIGGLFWLLQAAPFAGNAGPMVAGFVVALTGSWFALLGKT